MAKGKSNNSTNSSSTSASKRKPAASSKGRMASTAKAPATASERSLTSDQIGSIAGEIWQVLDKKGGQSLATIKKSIDAPSDLIVAAIGWLAREDKLDISNSGRSVRISLRSGI